ncbi:MAG: MBL fold metallo-hydrolase [Solirubrobacteraceae bacterium]|nr:MBL fold metallo-hydrolase [Solirubrobacteraceae bacterium]
MRALSLHPDVVVVTSSVWQTSATLVRGPGEFPESVLVDSPLLPVELDALRGLADSGGFDVRGLLATHADWDHVLGRLAFPEAAVGLDERSAARLTARLGEPQRRLREFDAEWYVQRPSPLALGELQPLPVPGRLELGEQQADVLDGAGHTGDGLLLWLPWAQTLIVGDYLSPVELPSWDETGSRTAYREALERLALLVPAARWVVVGHGGPVGRDDALRILDEDRDYLESGSPPSRGARSTNRTQHATNLAAWDRPAVPIPELEDLPLPGPPMAGRSEGSDGAETAEIMNPPQNGGLSADVRAVT